MNIHNQGTRRADARPILFPIRASRRALARAMWLAAALLGSHVHPAEAVRTPDIATDAGFIIPGAGAVRLADPAGRARLDRMTSWQSFRARHGKWNALWNASTASPHRAFGPPIPLPGFADRADAVETAVRAFIADHPDLFGTPTL